MDSFSTKSKVEATTVENVLPCFFAKFDLLIIQSIPASDRWNIDGAGIMEDPGRTQWTSSRKVRVAEIEAIQKDTKKRDWATFIEGISTAGQKLQPLIVFRGNSP